jgi:hyperosmotically inducible protein
VAERAQIIQEVVGLNLSISKPMAVATIALIFGIASVTVAQNAAPVSPENPAINSTDDRSPGAITAGQESNASSDVELTRKIRIAVVGDSSLSTLAHNIKTITTNGNVTLRGPVIIRT